VLIDFAVDPAVSAGFFDRLVISGFFLRQLERDKRTLRPFSLSLSICGFLITLHTSSFELFTKHRVHRILVLEEIPVRSDDQDQDEAEAKPRQQPNGRLVSQTDVIKFLLEHNHELGSILDTTAEQTAGHALRYSQEYLDGAAAVQLKQTPASITINCVAWTALQTMSTSQASCVAIVGKIAGAVFICNPSCSFFILFFIVTDHPRLA